MAGVLGTVWVNAAVPAGEKTPERAKLPLSLDAGLRSRRFEGRDRMPRAQLRAKFSLSVPKEAMRRFRLESPRISATNRDSGGPAGQCR
jgi:hypothetical protein